jgi:hypothetical protein
MQYSRLQESLTPKASTAKCHVATSGAANPLGNIKRRTALRTARQATGKGWACCVRNSPRQALEPPKSGHVGCPRRRLSHKDRPPQPPKNSLCLLPPSRPHPIKAPPPTHHTAIDHHPPWRPEPKRKRRASCRSRSTSTLALEMRYVYSPAICSSAAPARRACFMLSIAVLATAYEGLSLFAMLVSLLATHVFLIALTARLGYGILWYTDHACAASTSERKLGCDGTRPRTTTRVACHARQHTTRKHDSECSC